MQDQIDFFQQVYQVARLVPHGRVTSYGAIGKYLGAAKSARMVGWAMNNAHSQPTAVPSHRVVNRNGLLTGKRAFENPNAMQELLEAEGVTIVEDQIVSFDTRFWDPSENLAL